MSDNFFRVRKGLNLTPTTLPTSGNVGDIILDPSNNKIKTWNGIQWRRVGYDLEELTPLYMKASDPANLVVTIGASNVIETDSNIRRSIPHISSSYVQFTSGTITFPASPTGNIVCSPGGSTSINIPTSHYAAVLVYLDATGNLNVIVGATDANENNAIQNLLPAPDETLPIGFVVIQNVSGTIQNIQQNKIALFGTGGGGSGSSSKLQEESIALRNTLDESYFKYLTPSIFADIEKTTLIDTGNTTATYNLITKTYNFTAGQVVRSLDLVDSSFYNEFRDIDEAMFVVFWDKDNVDTNATYQLSRDNGVTWQTVTMTRNGLTGEYSGVKKFSAETLSTTGSTAHTSDQVINITTSKKVSQKFTLSEARVVKEFTVSLKKTGTPGGNIVAKLVKDSGGNPSLSVTDLIAYDEKSISSMSGGIATYTFNFGLQALKAGDYHIVFETNINYDNTFVSGSHEVAVGLDTAGSNPEAKIYNGTSWSNVSGQTIKLQYSYKSLKLLARITASATAKLKGFGVLYSSDPDFVSPVSYMNIIIGSTAQVDSGLATHTSLSNALNDAGAGSAITMLKTTVAGGVTWNQDGVVVRGEGFLSVINGNLTISGNDNILQNVKINGNLVVNGDYNVIRDCWVTGTVTDNGNANMFSITLGS